MTLLLSAYTGCSLLYKFFAVQDSADLVQVEACQSLCSVTSSACATSSRALAWWWVTGGRWAHLDLHSKASIEVLAHCSTWGGHLSSRDPSPPENWQQVEVRVLELWQAWACLLWCLSLRGRLLVINQLIRSMLWHCFNTLPMPPEVLARF